MTQQSPLSSNTEGAGSGPQPAGNMTAVMRAVANSGPKVLRIGLIQGGRVVEERIIKQRTSVTVGANEKNMFVIPGGDLPASFRLFELVGSDYHLNFTPAMKGRLALPTGLSELNNLRGQARTGGQGGHQIQLTEDSRGKVVIGDTTFLFQFVAPPPIQPRPQLPVSVTRGAASVDWPTTVIAAFSFLVHFCAIGSIYSDWLDPVVDYDVNVSGLVESVKSLPAPPPVEEPEQPAAEKQAQADTPKAEAPKPTPKAAPTPAGKEHVNKAQAAAISHELESLEMATLAALSGVGPATANVLRSGEVPTSALDAAAASEAGVSNAGPGGLKLGGAGGTVRPGATGGGLASIGASGKSAGSGSGSTQEVKGPRGSASMGDASVAGGAVSDASRVVAQMRAGFRACYNRGLAENPDIEGKIQLSIKVGPTGQVASVAATKTGNLPDSVVECVKSRANSANFSAPSGGAAVVQVPVSFVKQ
ncbi:MAG: AgmX/PglI C-terminal domain-containing protein [Deltaproteobacteria bacterium]